jgi:hypothetical protein
MSDRMQRIRFEDLPLTFKDAVRICRDLEQQYLWIDSLCIVQDDGEDWSEAAAAMASIYGGSYVTLAALASADPTQGCRIQPRDPDKPKLSRYQDFNFGSRRVRLFEDWPTYWHLEYGDNPFMYEGYGGTNPLRTRAWTMQERELSLRCIHFSQGQLLWQCRTMKGSSEVPWHEMMRKHDEVFPLPLKLEDDEDFSPSGPAFRRDHWYRLVEDYSSRYLTYETDKLPALAGLASNFQHEAQPHGKYLAGIWSSHLPSALLWRTVMPYSERRGQKPTNPLGAFQPRRPQAYRAPSWSWASVDGEISYDSQREIENNSAIFNARYPDFKITGSEIQGAMALQSLGSPSDASLRIHGRISEVEINKEITEDDLTERFRHLIAANGAISGAIYPDILDDLKAVRRVVVLSIRSEPYFSSGSMPSHLHELYKGGMPQSDQASWGDLDLRMGLALLRVRSGEVYRRVGLVRWLRKEVFDGTQSMELTIV